MSFLIYYSCNTADRDLNPVVESIDIKSSLLNVPPGFGAGQMGNIALPGNTDTRAAFQEEALFENTVAHQGVASIKRGQPAGPWGAASIKQGLAGRLGVASITRGRPAGP